MTDEHALSLLRDRAAVIHRFRPEDGERFDTYCAYTHALVRTPAGWKISAVKQTVYWNTGNPDIHSGARR